MRKNVQTTMRVAMLATAAFISLIFVTLGLASTPIAAPHKTVPVEKLDYNRDIRPILSAKCFSCHGQDPKGLQAGLRLDVREDATKTLASGERAIVPGNLAKSELVQRISSVGPIQMPPPDSHKCCPSATSRR